MHLFLHFTHFLFNAVLTTDKVYSWIIMNILFSFGYKNGFQYQKSLYIFFDKLLLNTGL